VALVGWLVLKEGGGVLWLGCTENEKAHFPAFPILYFSSFRSRFVCNLECTHTDTISTPPILLYMCHSSSQVHQQLGQPSEAIVHFGRALKLREEVLKSAEDLVFQINNGNGSGVSGSKRQAQHALRAARAAVASTLYNRGLIYHQQVRGRPLSSSTFI